MQTALIPLFGAIEESATPERFRKRDTVNLAIKLGCYPILTLKFMPSDEARQLA
jgi:hypothetical protein